MADCTAGKKVVGGGYEVSSVSNAAEIAIENNFPSDNDTWSVTATNDSTAGDASFAIRAYALCVTAP